ncbi:MAG: phosphate acyltransferase PlsX [Acidiferrobacterales bacterium]|nr:phosphate acyltransferase PlsX [Acidiferrobacterales bacterium]
MVHSIAIDAMGGDFGPEVTVPAALSVLEGASQLKFVLTGDQDEIHRHLKKARASSASRIEVCHTSEVVEMDEPPVHALRKKKNSSLRVAIDLVKDGTANACVSAGNTGALMAISHFVLRTFPGIHRPAIISSIPTVNGHVNLLDLGANVDCSSRDLLQFGIMGSTFVKCTEQIDNPRVALLNIGVENIKGNQIIKQAAELFQSSDLNYQGFVEGDAIFEGNVDVIVCDGFAGNVALKASEGVSKFIQHALRTEFQKNLLRRISGLVATPVMKGVKARIDPRVYNGAALIGLQGTVIKSHGGADQLAFSYALRKALIEISNDVPSQINQQISAAAEVSP